MQSSDCYQVGVGRRDVSSPSKSICIDYKLEQNSVQAVLSWPEMDGCMHLQREACSAVLGWVTVIISVISYHSHVVSDRDKERALYAKKGRKPLHVYVLTVVGM